MRNPLRKAGICLGLILFGLALASVGVSSFQQLGPIVATIVGVVGMSLAIVCSVILLWSFLTTVGYLRLIAGKGVIARWHLTPAEWERFRALDALRAAQDLSLRNDLRIRKETPPDGVDVIVGRRQLIVDDSYHALRCRASPSLRGVNWMPAPADPECLEFTVEYPRGRYGGMFNLTLRVPVPAQAGAEGARVFEHYHAFAPQLKR